VFVGDPDVSEAVYRLLKAAQEGRRLQEEVGCNPQYDLAAGIRQTVEWWRHSLDRDPVAAAVAESNLAESAVTESAVTKS